MVRSGTQGVGPGVTEPRPSDSPHVCLIFDNDEQRLKILSEFLALGIRRGERVRCFVDSLSPEDLRAKLLELGVDVDALPGEAPFSIVPAESAYCPSGRFDPEKSIARILAGYEAAEKAGYSGSRSCGEMTWSLRDIPGADRLLEYEVMIGAIATQFPHCGMCQYDARKFDGATLFKVLQVHPYMIAQGQMVNNPFYVRPDEYMKEAATKHSVRALF